MITRKVEGVIFFFNSYDVIDLGFQVSVNISIIGVFKGFIRVFINMGFGTFKILKMVYDLVRGLGFRCGRVNAFIFGFV